jgi:F0F1-type ATP synthase membrane subunit b/b'
VKAVILFLLTGAAYAAGDGHAGPSSLIPAAVNLIILFGAITYFTKDTIVGFFNDKSKSTQDMIERASVKAKEAKLMMEVQQKKINGADAEIQSLGKDVEDVLTSFDSNYSKEVSERIQNLKEDAGQKIEAEKNELLNELNSNLLDEVLSKTKMSLRNDKSLNADATKRIIEGIK